MRLAEKVIVGFDEERNEGLEYYFKGDNIEETTGGDIKDAECVWIVCE